MTVTLEQYLVPRMKSDTCCPFIIVIGLTTVTITHELVQNVIFFFVELNKLKYYCRMSSTTM